MTVTTTMEFVQRLGKYTLLDTLGTGAIGVVYQANLAGPMGFRKQVALKTIRTDKAPSRFGLQSLINEARLGGQLQHRNIVSTLDFGQEGETFYIAMEYVQGYTLEEVLRRVREQGPLPPAVLSGIAVQICTGLAYAHAATDDEGNLLNLVHRDLKPSNVMITHGGQVKLMDFGISTATNNLYRDEPGETAGTPAYMSPEQIHGSPLDYRSDLFSLATLIGEMITGRPVFHEQSLAETMRRVGEVDLGDVIERVWMHMPQSVRVLLRAWRRDPEERYGSAETMRSSIHRACRSVGTRPAGEEKIGQWLEAWMRGGRMDDGDELCDVDEQSLYSVDDGFESDTHGYPPDVFQHTTAKYVAPPSKESDSEDSDEIDQVVTDELDLGSSSLESASAVTEELNAIDSMVEWSDELSYGFATAARAGNEPRGERRDDAQEKDQIPEPAVTVEQDWIRVRAGGFWRGSPENEPGRQGDEVRHQVKISRSFLVSNLPVTQALWRQVVGHNPSEWSDPEHPVTNISWFDAVLFCNRYSESKGLEPAYKILDTRVVWNRESTGFRLLSEAEWEYAARAGSQETFTSSSDPAQGAWFAENADGRTHPAGAGEANRWGLLGVCGNVWEWVWDRYESNPEANSTVDPAGHWSNPRRVARGGAWNSPREDVRVSIRRPIEPMEFGNDLGLRIARSLPWIP